MKREEPKKQKSKRRLWIERAAQVALLFAVLFGIQAWQTRHMRKTGEKAPSFVLTDLDGNQVSLNDADRKEAVLYFFAPWCSVCSASSHNINALREVYAKKDLAVYAVGLGWESKDDLVRFADEHALSVPVLIGTEQTSKDYRISIFPSIYILDEGHRIAHRLVGYTTELGLRLRVFATGV